MSWRPGPTNPYFISDGYKTPGAGYKSTVTDGDGAASPPRSPGSITVDNDYRCVALSTTTTTILYRIGSSAPTLTTFDGIIYPESNYNVNIRLPDGVDVIKFITVATGNSATATAYATAFKENS